MKNNGGSTYESFDTDKLNILDCREIRLTKEKSGFLTLEYNGQTYRRVNLTRLVPFDQKTKFISVNYENADREFTEIGVIRDMAELDREQYETANGFLEYKYYMPLITKIRSVKENVRGTLIVKAETSAGSKDICIRDWYRNFKLIGGRYLYVCDVDGNKYYCDDVEKRLDSSSITAISMFT